MRTNYRLNNKAQDLPGWTYIIAMILGLFTIIFLLWLAAKSGNFSVDLFGRLR